MKPKRITNLKLSHFKLETHPNQLKLSIFNFQLLFIALLLRSAAYSQVSNLSGKVVDDKSGVPLAFVNLIANNNPTLGTISDIDGKFQFPTTLNVSSISLSYVGYEKLTFVPIQSPSLIKLKVQSTQLKEVTVKGGENPAHRIIENASHNKKLNDPEELKSFQFESYNKLYFTANFPSKDSATPPPDAETKKAEDFFSKGHIFLIESINQRSYQKPQNQEKVLASRVSGFQDQTFAIVASQLQSFSFYENYIAMGDKKFLNPISPGSTSKYLFVLEDTIMQGRDSVFVISYRPRKNTNFDGLQGLLYINDDGWAIQQVIAEATEQKGVSIKIQQQYEKIAKHWFPVQLNTDLTMNGTKIANVPLSGVGRSYLKNIKINDTLVDVKFNRFDVEIEELSGTKPESFWGAYRVDSLTAKDLQTYRFIDSVGKAFKMDKKLKWLKAFVTGKLPIGFIDLDLTRLIGGNDYEGFRLGLGASINKKLSGRFSLGGYFAYGTKDDALKYAGNLDLFLHKKSELTLTLGYKHDLMESGGSSIIADRTALLGETYRKTFNFNRDFATRYDVMVKVRAFQYWLFQGGVSHQEIKTLDNYQFGQTDKGGAYITTAKFQFAEAMLGFRFAYMERFLKTGTDEFSKGTKFPILFASVTKGFVLNTREIQGEYNYWRLEARLEDDFYIRNLGTESYNITGGMVLGDVPYNKLFAGRSGWYKFPIAVQNYFETMRANEFLTDKYIALFHRHSFGTLLVKSRYFSPEIVLINNVGFGWLANPSSQHFRPTRDYRHGYFETGLLLNNILKINIAGYGFGVYYRYGGYQLGKPIDNWAFKLSLTLSLGK